MLDIDPQTRAILGMTAALLAIIVHIPYLLHTYQGRTNPHAFSWFIWALLGCIGYFGQKSANAGPGAWVYSSANAFN